MEKDFDHIANQYDVDFTFSEIGKRQRFSVYHYLKKLPNNLTVLELNCGTGEDAIWFAKKGYDVLATDISSEMIKIGEKKAAGIKNLNFQQLDINKINYLKKYETNKFDLMFSNFGGLNCLSPIELQNFFKSTRDIIKQNGSLILVIMPKNTLWERIYFLLKGKFKTAFRRNTKESINVNVTNKEVKTWYYNPKDIVQLAHPYFEIERTKPIGFFIPPSYLETFFKKHTLFLKTLNTLEKSIARFGFLSRYSDHYLIEFKLK